ncbi:tRNA pseudouridine(38-40) synthase TruA [bacterium]|nr:tRNA pseudouridine(38-40) synthase TruA [bacterium]
MQTVKLTIEYDGTDFSGWQIQPRERTVQEEVEKALSRMEKRAVSVTGSGRTDAGVHALGQVAHFKTGAGLEAGVYRKALNALLPADIRILASERVPDGFHARYDAVRREYRYVIAREQHALGRQYAWFPGPHVSLDTDRMSEAAALLTGEHDFTSFSRNPAADGTCNSVVYAARVSEREKDIVFDISAVRFFHNMVRILAGTLYDVGRGYMSPEAFASLLTRHDRRKAGPTAPPHGLFLVRVIYKEEK